MKTRLLRTGLCVGALFAAALLAAPVHADGILDVTLTTNNPVVTEGDSGFLDITVTNSGSVGVILAGPGVGITGPTAGDPSDHVDFFNFDTSMSTCGAFQTSLGAGSSCTFVFDLTTDSAADETDADSGVTPASADVNYDIPGVGVGYTASATFTFTVNDPGVATTPEPSSLLLLGSGLLGVFGLGWKRLT